MPDAYAGIVAERESADVRNSPPESATPSAGSDRASGAVSDD